MKQHWDRNKRDSQECAWNTKRRRTWKLPWLKMVLTVPILSRNGYYVEIGFGSNAYLYMTVSRFPCHSENVYNLL